MPGFQIIGGEVTNCGGIGNPSNTVEYRRKHRWVFQLIGGGAGIPDGDLIYLHKAERPKFKFEEPVVHHNQEQVYLAGKQEWEPLKMSFYDVNGGPDISEDVWKWLNGVNNIATVCVAPPGSTGSQSGSPGYKGTSLLSSVDGCGYCDETWQLYGCWPQSIDFSDLDYGNTEVQEVSVIMRYDRAIRNEAS